MYLRKLALAGGFFTSGFNGFGNRGCGTRRGLREFQDNRQKPLQSAFKHKVCVDKARLFMGIPPTGRRVVIRSMDFRKVADGRASPPTDPTL